VEIDLGPWLHQDSAQKLVRKTLRRLTLLPRRIENAIRLPAGVAAAPGSIKL
jgi:hypothetical protein